MPTQRPTLVIALVPHFVSANYWASPWSLVVAAPRLRERLSPCACSLSVSLVAVFGLWCLSLCVSCRVCGLDLKDRIARAFCTQTRNTCSTYAKTGTQHLLDTYSKMARARGMARPLPDARYRCWLWVWYKIRIHEVSHYRFRECCACAKHKNHDIEAGPRSKYVKMRVPGTTYSTVQYQSMDAIRSSPLADLCYSRLLYKLQDDYT
jgi:hypothetical protein